MPKPKAEAEYTSNNSFMTSQVKAPKPFGDDYEDPLEALKAQASIVQSKILTFDSNESSEKNNIKTGLTELTELSALTKPTELVELTEPTKLTELIRPVINQPISPIRDFTKTPNSIGRHVMAKGLFKGKSKQIYDFLWMSSRGSINPSRTVRKTHGEIQTGTGIGSLNTIKNGLKYLDQIGLIKKTSAVGEASGNIYEIFTPEEVNLIDKDRPVRPVSSVSSVSQEMVQPVRPETDRTNLTQLQAESIVYEDTKTSFKDNTKTSDDEAFAGLTKILTESFERISGKKANHSDGGKLIELAELLVMELELAAARTKSVSNAPAFLTEHLRRRLMSNPGQPKVKNKSTQIGKQNPAKPVEAYQAEPLTEKAKETTLKAFISYMEKGQKDYVLTLEDSYTKEDWQWLIGQISEK